MTQDKARDKLIDTKITEILLAWQDTGTNYILEFSFGALAIEIRRAIVAIIQESMKPEVDEPLNDEEKDEGIGTEHSIYSPMGKVPSNPVKQFIDDEEIAEIMAKFDPYGTHDLRPLRAIAQAQLKADEASRPDEGKVREILEQALETVSITIDDIPWGMDTPQIKELSQEIASQICHPEEE